MTRQPEVIEADINAAARIIGDISVGIYRSPANALKELVSNAFDAGATEVFINTDYPALSSVSCFDNGPGMATDELQTVLRYIGGSNKRLEGERGSHGRPIIGKIGIGILGMCQITKRFVILSSREGDNFRLEAEINIEEFVSRDAARTNLGGGRIGHYRIYRIPESGEAHYTIIATPAASETLRDNLGPGKSPRDFFTTTRKPSAETFKGFVGALCNGKRGKPTMTMTAYESFIWELATLCPVAYFDEGPVVRWSGWDEIKESLKRFKFAVTVDGYELRKPILLPTADDLRERGSDYEVYPFSYRDEDKIGLDFEGYMFHQRTQITPPELQGLLVRVRNVGIGGYDASMLKYPRAIGPMVRGMTGEVHVHRGLEEALNIDRNSFNETNKHFLKLREVVFRHIGIPEETGIATKIRERSKRHQEVQSAERTSRTFARLVRRVERLTGRKWRWEEDEALDAPLALQGRGRIKVNLGHDTVPKGSAARNEFLRVYLASQLLEQMGPPPDDGKGLVGWLRKL